ncbi:HpcH/HpaI aldolase/citrate lyase family protein [Paracoccus shanxieyensis]|uniref:CoA ester lyase n=1 Tax=Paracoccus shanxieyensis TaxID=2675752 RepID=A0A6L6IW87_9RHOB|nr:CoA ester lyase [Paracoccus shanxieyensis]MTH64159.1 CoA ester lyase [Paracoccus shanxieyensis]MTH87303.1 CoA ester lyase [Paracoccus shanxieyensis]
MVTGIRAPLFVPANRPERFAKAAASGADAVILDLEDAVAADAKDAARAALACDFTDLPVIVRINAHGTVWHDADVAAVAALQPAAVILPKAEDAAITAAVAAALDLPVIALIESALGLAQVRAIAQATGVVRLAFGSVDFCADLGCAHLREVLLPARSELVLASRLAGIEAPIDGVTVQLDDPAISHDDAAHARALGMTGKLCIHPRQIAEVRRAFAPTPGEIDWARRVLASGDGAVSVEGAMVDEPVRIRARAVLAQAGG